MADQHRPASLRASFDRLASGLAGIGRWTERWSFWAFFAVASVVVVLKTGFKWAGTTREGWFIEFREVIDSWPLKEQLAGAASPAWQENYSPIVVFKALTTLGAPYNSATWNFLHMAASVGAIVFLGMWARRTYGDRLGKVVALVLLFGAAPIVLLQEIGRYDSFFFLGAVLLAAGRRWWTIALGALLVGTSTWTMGAGFVLTLVLVGLVVGSRSLIVRGILGIAGCVLAVVILMLARIALGGDPGLVRLGNLDPTSDDSSFSHLVYQTWLNVVQPFPNWIYAAFGVTWILFVLVVLQARRRWALLAVSLVLLPVTAGVTNAGDGTREIALALAAVLVGAATVLESQRAEDADAAEPPPLGPVVVGLILVVCLVAPVIDINPNQPLNPYGWLSDYGLSAVYSVLN